MEELKVKWLLFPDSNPRERASSAPVFLPKGVGAKKNSRVIFFWESQLFPFSQKTYSVQTVFPWDISIVS